ncbi:unnamed protein product [Strongylus vulgaris]|uniref:Uncharacterized protein n=1 Tax=Strongylus vulgaris TaxID=40348 RepID=A0A3P7IGS8_STRVU|nr:unnamed protein product [Strongylus vulgaris]
MTETTDTSRVARITAGRGERTHCGTYYALKARNRRSTVATRYRPSGGVRRRRDADSMERTAIRAVPGATGQLRPKVASEFATKKRPVNNPTAQKTM